MYGLHYFDCVEFVMNSERSRRYLKESMHFHLEEQLGNWESLTNYCWQEFS